MTQHWCAGTKARFLTEFAEKQSHREGFQGTSRKAHYGFSVVLGGFASRRTRCWNLPLLHTRRCGPVRPIALNQSQYEADEGLASAEWPKCDAVLALLNPIVARQNQRIIERGWALKSKASWFFACGNCTARIRRRPDTGVLRGRSRRGHHLSRIKSARTRQIRERIARFPTSCTREPHSAPGQIAPTAAEARQPSKAEVSHYGVSRFR